MPTRTDYYLRAFRAYVLRRNSHLGFWHDDPTMRGGWDPATLGPYYMDFSRKADHQGPFDPNGVPLLDYGGRIGLQHNPIAIAQYGLGNLDGYLLHAEEARLTRAAAAADWLVDNLRKNRAGHPVWLHEFDWNYASPLIAPWYSGLAQGQGLSLLVRMHEATGEDAYLACASDAFVSMTKTVDAGGVLYRSGNDVWIEEYVVDPPTHILNGWIWASWGLHDFYLATGDGIAGDLFDATVETLVRHLGEYDTGYWSLYEVSPRRLKMVASPFYHRLHIVQLRVLHRLTGIEIFADVAERWDAYSSRLFNRNRAVAEKVLFKLCYY